MQAIKKALTGHSSHSHHETSPKKSPRVALESEVIPSGAAVAAPVAVAPVAAVPVAAAPVAAAPVVATSAAMDVEVPAGLEAQTIERDAVQVETIVKPEVVHETVQQLEEEVIKPVVERDREQTEIHQVVQPILDRQVNETQVVEKIDATENREFREELSAEDQAMYARNAAVQNESRNIGTERTTVVNPTVVNERVHHRIIEEVQPVIEREVLNPTVISHVKPVYEKVVHAPVITSSVRAPIVASAAGLVGNRLDSTKIAAAATTHVQQKSVGLAGAVPAAQIVREE